MGEMKKYEPAYNGLAYKLRHANSSDFFTTNDKEWDNSTPAQRSAWKQQAIERDEYEKQLVQEMRTYVKAIVEAIDILYGKHTNYKGKPIDWASKDGKKVKDYMQKYSPFGHWSPDRHLDMWKRCETARISRIEKVEKEKRLKEQEQKRATAKRDELIQLTAIAIRNGFEAELSTDPFELMLKLETKDHRLPLAIAMQNARGDFSRIEDVESVIRDFEPVDETDKAIKADIQECFDEYYPDDGRVFRDTEWNYSRIFDLIDKQLVEDVQFVNDVLNSKVYG